LALHASHILACLVQRAVGAGSVAGIRAWWLHGAVSGAGQGRRDDGL